MMDEQSQIFVVSGLRSSETARVTSGPVRRWRMKEVVVVGCSLSLTEAWQSREGWAERGAVGSVVGEKQGTSGPWSLELG